MGRERDPKPQLIVVTDLDGTLLDHHTYEYGAAIPALQYLNALGIPLILSSSKTASEMREIRQRLELDTPFVCENGACIYLPGSTGGMDRVAFATPRAEILGRLAQIKQRHHFRFAGFADMSVGELVQLTGLRPEQAMRAKEREFTEPLYWQDTEENLEHMRTLLVHHGLEMVRGGRFVHVMGKTDKGSALVWLRRHFAEITGRTVTVLALGDSDNDVEMLQAADYPVVVRSPVKSPPVVDHPRCRITEAIGPEGWNRAVLEHLTHLRLIEKPME